MMQQTMTKEDTLQLTNELFFQVEGRHYIYQGLSGVVTEVDEMTTLVLKSFTKNEKTTRKEIADRLDGKVEQDSVYKVIDELVKLEVIAQNGLIGRYSQTPGVPVQKDLPIQTLVFHLINECNLNCSYCYAAGGDYGNPMFSMKQETAEKAIDFLIKESGESPKVSVVLFGGEPTMNWQLLKRTVEYGTEATARAGKQIDFSLTTNGTLLTDERMKFLAAHNIGVTISMDGTDEVQDQYRVFNNGSGSYDIVSKNAQKFINLRPQKPVAVRVTLNKGFPSIKDTFYHFMDLGFHEVGFAPVSSTDENFMLKSKELWHLLDEFEELAEEFTNAAIEDRYLGFSNLVNILVELHTGVNKGFGCGAGLGFMAVNPQGNLFLCHRFNEQMDYKMGDIYSGVDRNFQRELLGSLHVDNKTTCSGCALKHTCSGGCYYEAKERMGEITSPNLHYCQWQEAWYKIGLKTYVKVMEQNPTFIDRMAGFQTDCHTS